MCVCLEMGVIETFSRDKTIQRCVYPIRGAVLTSVSPLKSNANAREHGRMQLHCLDLPSSSEAGPVEKTTLCRHLPLRTTRGRPLLVVRGQARAVLHRGNTMDLRNSSRNLTSGRLHDEDEDHFATRGGFRGRSPPHD